MQELAANGHFGFHRITKKDRNSKIMNCVYYINFSCRRNLSGLRGNSVERNEDQENK